MFTFSQTLSHHETLALTLGDLLTRHAKTITLAESCTGGGCAQAVTAVPGSSAWFETGFVTYSNASKMMQLAVPLPVLDTFGAVSCEVVEAMVKGALQVSKADFALAVSGIAGPGGGCAEKPLGTVWIAVGSLHTTQAQKYQFLGSRSSVREQSVTAGLKNLVKFCSECLN